MGKRRPNIIVILSDEQRWDSLGLVHDGVSLTPHLDALAARGAVFERAYTAYPLCCPARASLWTGLQPHRHHVWGNWRAIRPELREGGLVAAFADAGYHTVYTGKWHVPGTTPARLGFAESSAIPAVLDGRDRGRFIEDYRSYAAAQGYQLLPTHIENLTQRDLDALRQPGLAPCGTSEIAVEHFLETWQTERFLEALERRPREQPVFAVCSYNAPHFPMIVPAPYDRAVSPEAVELPPNFCTGLDGKPDEVLRSPHHTDVANLSEAEWRRLIAHYLGLCSLVDTQVGRVVAYLDATGDLDNTIVVFTSDHGDMLGSHCLTEKGHELHYEETLRVPLIITHPDAGHGHRADHFVSLIDLLPTLAELAGIRLNVPIDGRSFATITTDTAPPPDRDHVIAESYLIDGQAGGQGEYTAPEDFDGARDSANLSIRTRMHRYVFRWDDHDELYDLTSDPYENINIVGQPGAEPIVADLLAMLAQSMHDAPPAIVERLRRESEVWTRS